jgi:hypothetical protein
MSPRTKDLKVSLGRHANRASYNLRMAFPRTRLVLNAVQFFGEVMKIGSTEVRTETM